MYDNWRSFVQSFLSFDAKINVGTSRHPLTLYSTKYHAGIALNEASVAAEAIIYLFVFRSVAEVEVNFPIATDELYIRQLDAQIQGSSSKCCVIM